ncbi:hypothetical protein ACLOJK_021861 [Asimina triloba]
MAAITAIMNKLQLHLTALMLCFLLTPSLGTAACECEPEAADRNRTEALRIKLIAIASILVAGMIGVSLPIVGRAVSAVQPDKDVYFLIKAFAAGVILATAMIHILPDALESLGSPCLNEEPWGKFPFAGFVAMMSAIVTLMVDTYATGYYKRLHVDKENNGSKDVDSVNEHAGHVHAHGHARGSALTTPDSSTTDVVRHRITSQVLELGIVVHSVIIGISLGASESPATIRPLVAALSFHQFFEGMGLGGCIVQAKFKVRSMAIMAFFFSLTTPIGIALGFGVSSVYKENSPTALIVGGILNSASAGILIYMALVDLLAADFMNPRMQSNWKLHLQANVSLLLGAGCMSLMAKWA